MSTLSKKHLLFCSGLLAVLAGCGGGGSDTLSANNAQATPAAQKSDDYRYIVSLDEVDTDTDTSKSSGSKNIGAFAKNILETYGLSNLLVKTYPNFNGFSFDIAREIVEKAEQVKFDPFVSTLTAAQIKTPANPSKSDGCTKSYPGQCIDPNGIRYTAPRFTANGIETLSFDASGNAVWTLVKITDLSIAGSSVSKDPNLGSFHPDFSTPSPAYEDLCNYQASPIYCTSSWSQIKYTKERIVIDTVNNTSWKEELSYDSEKQPFWYRGTEGCSNTGPTKECAIIKIAPLAIATPKASDSYVEVGSFKWFTDAAGLAYTNPRIVLTPNDPEGKKYGIEQLSFDSNGNAVWTPRKISSACTRSLPGRCLDALLNH